MALEFHEEEYSSELKSLDSLLQKGEITYDLLWAIFKPGCYLFTADNSLKEPQIMKHVYINKVRDPDDETKTWMSVGTAILHHDGELLGWTGGIDVTNVPITIHQFKGSRAISSLDIYPLQHHEDPEGMRKRLLERGRQYLELQNPVCREYNGLASYTVFEAEKWVEKRFNASGRVMVDPVAFRTKDPDNTLTFPRISESVDKEELTDDEIVCCDHRILGFSIRQKRWGAFSVSKMYPVEWNTRAIDRVIMPPRKHAIIKTLVKSHLTRENLFDDIISGKGKGLVGLLSGGPGVGKSLTAEAVSEWVQRPLYTVTSADLGVAVDEIDSNLEMILEFTRRWGSVLLIDEADVFLQKRNPQQLDVNALVSVFLRHLE